MYRGDIYINLQDLYTYIYTKTFPPLAFYFFLQHTLSTHTHTFSNMADDNSPPNLLQLPDNSIMEAEVSSACAMRFTDSMVQPPFIGSYPGPGLTDPMQAQYVPLIPQMFALGDYSSNPMALVPASTASASALTLTAAANPLQVNMNPAIQTINTNQLGIPNEFNESNENNTTNTTNANTNTSHNEINTANITHMNPSPLVHQNISFNYSHEITHSSQYLELLPSIENSYIFDKKFNKVNVFLSGTLSGNFFISRTKPDDETQESKEYDLTFYRRNLFQISCTIRNARDAYYAVANNEYSKIVSLKLGISVTGSDETKPIKLLYSPPKSNNSNGTSTMMAPTTPTEIEPNLKRVFINDSGYDEVIDWKRLQFSSATAHNGRKRLQNFFTITVTLYAELENAQRIELMKSHSRPIVVRGRNPRFYQLRENIPLSENPLINRTKPFKSYHSNMGIPFNNNTAHNNNNNNTTPITTTKIESPFLSNKSTASNNTESTNLNTTESTKSSLGSSNTTSNSNKRSYEPDVPESNNTSTIASAASTTSTSTASAASSNPHKRFKTSKTSLSIHDETEPQSDDGEEDGGGEDANTHSNTNKCAPSSSCPGLPALEESPSSPSSASEPEDQSEDQSLLDPDDVLLDHYNTYQYIAIDHAYWSPPVEVVYRPHAAKHMFPTQQQMDQQVEAQHQQLIGSKGGVMAAIGGLGVGGNIPLIKRKFSAA